MGDDSRLWTEHDFCFLIVCLRIVSLSKAARTPHTHKQQTLLWWCPAGVRRRRDKLLRNRQRRSSSADWSAAAVWPFLLSVLTEQEKHRNWNSVWRETLRHSTINSKIIYYTLPLPCFPQKCEFVTCCCHCSLQDLSPTFILPGTDGLQHNPSPVRLCLTSGGKL